MSIEKTPSGYRVRWREGGRNRAKLIGPRKADAIAFEQEMLRAKRMGTLAHMEMGTDTFETFARTWWERHASRKAHKTQVLYAYLLDKHIAPYFGQTPLAQIDVASIEQWLSELERQKTGRVAQHKALSLLSGILGKAVRWQKLATNPAAYAERPKVVKKPVKPPTPLEVEHVRERLLGAGRPGDATLVAVLAYGGLRPQEALGLVWGDVGARTLVVHSPKTNANRAVPLLAPLRKDLAEWKLLMENRHDLVFPNRRGEQWSESGWSNWRRRVWAPIVAQMTSGPEGEVAEADACLPGKTGKRAPASAKAFNPYALRHLYVSLLIREGLPLTVVASYAGHSVAMCLKTYAHLIVDEASGSAEGEILKARAEVHGVPAAYREARA